MDRRKWESLDRKSRELTRRWLMSIGATNIVDSVGNCSYDLKCDIRGKVTLVEVKDRNFPHTRYGDVFCEEDKRTCNNRRIGKGEAQHCIVVNVFTDGVLCVANVNDKRGIVKTMYCPQTTMCDDRSHAKVEKRILSLPQAMRFKFSKDGRTFERLS